MPFFRKLPKSKLVVPAIVLAVILFAALNTLSARLLRSDRIDLTANHLYSLSKGTRSLLANLKEPIHLRLFLSQELIQSAPELSAYATRVRAVLNTYASLSHGHITLEVIDPKPFSAEEDHAVGLGINRIQVAGAEDPLFFGLAATNSTDGHANIAVFSPDREPFLEYDLTRTIAKLAEADKPVVALIDGLGLAGNPMSGRPEAQVLQQMGDTFTVKTVGGDVDKFPDATKVVMIVHPQHLSDRTLYALDQWVLAGGATFVFVDPYAETADLRPDPRTGAMPTSPSSDLRKLFTAWGVGFDPKRAVADPDQALDAERDIRGMRTSVPNYPWIAIQGDNLDKKDGALADLSTVVVTTAGAFTAHSKDIKLQPLLEGSQDAGLVEAARAASPYGDPRELLSRIDKAAGRPIIAARLEGKLKTAFPLGKPKGSQARGTPLKEAKGKPNVVLVGDADILMDRNWIDQRQMFGQTVAQPFANNGDFVLNTLEQMAGGIALADLRGRAVSWRPFTRIQALTAAAQEKFDAKRNLLTQQIRDTEQRLQSIGTPKNANGDLVSADSAQAVEQLRSELLSARAALRNVQFDLRRDVDDLKMWIMVLAIGVIPAIVAIAALRLVLRRPKLPLPRRSPAAQAAHA